MKKLALFLGLTVAAAALLPGMALAQTTTDPGAIIQNLKEEKRLPSRLDDTVVVPKQEASGAGLSTKKAFVLKGVVLEKTQAYDGVDLSSLYSDLLGQEVSFADLHTITQRITRKYREEGYIFSRAILPPQNISDGVVHLRAVEGHIANVQVVGTFTDDNGLIRKMADKLKTKGPANTKEIERYLLLIDDLPGITAKSFVKPSETREGGDLIVSIEEDDFEGAGSFDNRGSHFIGPYKGTLVGAFNSALGLHDRTTLRGILTTQPRELRFADITHEQQIGSEGGKVKIRGALTETQPGGSLSVQDIDGSSRLLDIEGVYPFLRSRNYNVNFLGGFTMLNSDTDIGGVQTSKDHVRSVRAGTTFDFIDSFKGVNQFDVQVIKGIDAFGTTDDGLGRSRANGEHEFLRGNLTATRIQDMWSLWSLMLSGSAQLSSDPLLASEEFSVGGATFGRAYDSGEISGDRGWAGIAELRYGGPVNGDYVQSYQVYSSIDYGKVWNKAPAVTEAARDSLTSAGLGVRFNLKQNLSGNFEVDKPLNKTVTSENDESLRLFFNVLKRF